MPLDSHDQRDLRPLYDLIDLYGFGCLVTTSNGTLRADHLPFVLRPGQGERGMLASHVGRRNPVVDRLRAGEPCLAIFQGPHGYISPTWYLRDDTVPTWNYVAVHVHGTPGIISDANDFRLLLETMTAKYEQQEGGWTVSKVEHKPYLFDAIVGFQIRITSVEARLKLSQNKAVADVEHVLEHTGAIKALDPMLVQFMRNELEKRR